MSFVNRMLPLRRQTFPDTGLIGLDCAQEAFHLVQFDRAHEHGVSLRAKASLPYPQPMEAMLAKPEILRKMVKEELRNERFAGNRIVSTLPSEQTSILSLSYRLASNQSEARVVAELMQERLGGVLSDWVIDYMPIRQGTAEERLALVAHARRDYAIAYLEMWRKCGLEVAALEIRPLAIKRLVYLIAGAPPWNALAINFGRERSYLTLFSARRVLYDQAVEFGETRLLDDLVEALDLPVELLRQLVYSQDLGSTAHQLVSQVIDRNFNLNDVFQEIVRPAFLPLIEAVDRALIFSASETRGESVKEIFLLGSLARWAGIETLMQTMLHLPVRKIPDPLLLMQDSQSGHARAGQGEPEIAVATGLALKNMLPHV